MRILERELRVLLDQEDRRPASCDEIDDLEDLFHHERCEPHRGLVEHEQLGAREHRPSDREHLLLAARERASQLPCALLEPRNHRVDLVDFARDLLIVIARERAHQQVFVHRQPGEDAAAFGAQRNAQPDERVRRRPCDVLATVEHAPARRLDEAGQRTERRGLAGAIGADQRDQFAFIDVEVDPFDGADAAVGDFQPLHIEQRAHAETPSPAAVAASAAPASPCAPPR